jgi:hypothetical protein
MTSPPPNIIRKVRVCPEHRVIIFEREDLFGRVQTGEFRHQIVKKERVPPLIDHKGKRCTHNEEHFILNDKFPLKHERHIVLRAHCFRADDGSIGGSGKLDPKELLIGDINYRQLEFDNPRCELCEAGDMIPPWKRFGSSTYEPSIWRYLRIRFRAIIGI